MPEETELVMVATLVMEPVKMHVHGFGALRLYTTVDDTLSSTVGLYRRRRLTMLQFL